MLTIYKKVEKTIDNPSGIVEIKNIEELDNPFLLCLSAQNNNTKSIYGSMREGAQAARVYTTQEMAAGFKIDDMPVDFLGVRFVADNEYATNYEEMVDKLFYPFLTGNGKMSFEEIKEQAKKINLMTYCNGTETYAAIESLLEERLKRDGYSSKDVDEILSQTSLTAIATMTDTSQLKATTVTFIDVNDDEIYTERTEDYQKLLESKNKSSAYGLLGRNITYVYDGTGNHSLKEYLADERIVKPVVCSTVSHFLEASISGRNKREELHQLAYYADELQSPAALLAKLDESLSYDNSPRYTKEEAQAQDKLEQAYKEIQKLRDAFQMEVTSKEKLSHQTQAVVEGIEKYSSETTYYQILVSAGLLDAPANRDVFKETSDKEFRGGKIVKPEEDTTTLTSNESIPKPNILETPSEKNVKNQVSEEKENKGRLEITHEEIKKLAEMLQVERTTKANLQQKIDAMIKGIETYSSETTFYQILVSAGLWNQPGNNRDVFQEESDKDIRNKYESILTEEHKPTLK